MKQVPNLLVSLERLNVHKCEKCPRVFSTTSSLMKHMSYHDERFLSHVFSAYVSVERDKLFKCKKCTQSFDTNREFMLHKLAHVQANVRNERKMKTLPLNHAIVKPYTCPDCDISFAAQSTLEAHSILHLPFPHICHCGIGYYKKDDLKGHTKLVHGLEQIIPQTKTESQPKNKSKKKKPKKQNWKVKLKSEDENTNSIKLKLESEIPEPDIEIRKTPDKKFECPECKKLFRERRLVIQHYRNHSGECPFECYVCQKAFKQAITLKKHIERHFNKERIYACKYCPKAFAERSYRDRHEIIHSSIKPYKCSFCGKGFHDPSAMTRHKRIHTGEKRFRCPYCPKAFCDVSALNVHKLRHEKNQQFRCDICDKRFYTQSDARKHRDIVHAQDKYFTCDYCKRNYICKYNLMTHILKMHKMMTNVYECKRCPNKFSSKANLKRHITAKHRKYKTKLFEKLDFRSYQKHKPTESVQCEICDKEFSCENTKREHLKIHFPQGLKWSKSWIELNNLKEV